MRKGFTLIEVLIALASMLLVAQLLVAILVIFTHMTVPKITQESLFFLQLKQLLYRTSEVSCVEASLFVDTFEIKVDKNRIVKKPGYEILVQELINPSLTCMDNEIVIEFISKDGDRYEETIVTP